MKTLLPNPTWHPASHPVSRARIEAVRMRAGDIDDDVIAARKRPAPVAYFQAKSTWWDASRTRRPPVPIVAVCPDGTIEHYRSITEAAQAMAISSQNMLHRIARDALCRDRRWYRLATWQAMGGGRGGKVKV